MESIHNNKVSKAEDTKVLGEIFKVEKEYENKLGQYAGMLDGLM